MLPLRFLCALVLLCCFTATGGCYYDRASELYPEGICDTTSITYSRTIQPILQQQCAISGCYAGSSPKGGIDLSIYAGVREQADNGALLGTVEHKPAYLAMPQGDSKLPDCQIAKLRIWVAKGAPEN